MFKLTTKYDECPNCGQYTISIYSKYKLLGGGFRHKCPSCNQKIKIGGFSILLFEALFLAILLIIVVIDVSRFYRILLFALTNILLFLFLVPRFRVRGESDE